MQKIKQLIKKYNTYIFSTIIILLIIIIGFMYGDNTTEKIDNENIVKEEKKEIKEEKITIKVDIKGEVKHPGVYEMTTNERVMDVITASGGLTIDADTNYINLSKKLSDEMVIIIYSKSDIEKYEKSLEKEEKIKEVIKYEILEKEIPCPNTTNNACINTTNTKSDTRENNSTSDESNDIETNEEKETELVNINTASKEQLLTLTGIGESKADLIIDYREENKFESIDDIKNVKGIGDSLFEKIKDYITI